MQYGAESGGVELAGQDGGRDGAQVRIWARDCDGGTAEEQRQPAGWGGLVPWQAWQACQLQQLL